MSTVRSIAAAVAIAFLSPLLALPASAQDTPTLLVLRPKPKAKDQRSGLKVAPVVQSDVAEIKIGGKPAIIAAWTPLLNGATTLQLVVLIDSQERIGVGDQFDDIRNLFVSLPSNVEIAVGYMLHGKTEIAQPFTTDRVLVGNALRPMTEEEAVSSKSDDGSPYRCLHDLAVNWPNPDPKKVRAVLMFTSGIPHDINGFGDLKEPPLLDLEVEMASEDLIGAGIAPFSVFYIDPVPRKGRPRQSGPGSLRPIGTGIQWSEPLGPAQCVIQPGTL